MTAPGGADRADAMGRRLERTARRLAVPAGGRTLIARAFRAAMEPRRERLHDDRDPDYLHPARTALILMDDAGVTDADTLAVGLLFESRDPTLRVPPAVAGEVGTDIAAALERLPRPDRDGERLLEALLALPDGLARVAAAERLDHARHLHLRERTEWPAYHAATRDIYAPLAGRVDRTLGQRYSWWCATFRRRFLEA